MTARNVLERLVTALEKGAEDDVLWESKQVCGFLGIHENTLYRLVREEKFPTVNLGGRRLRFLKKDVIAWIGRRRHAVGLEPRARRTP